MSKKNNKQESRAMITRIVCLALAGVMVLSSLLAAIMSQVF